MYHSVRLRPLVLSACMGCSQMRTAGIALAANQGNTRAQFNPRIMSEDSRGITQDYTEALRWFRPASWLQAHERYGIPYEKEWNLKLG
jgi:hypothetical protein